MPLVPRLFLIVVALVSLAGSVQAAEGGANAIFLVARRGMTDPNFRETVVLVTLPPRGVPIGVVINRPLERRLSEAFPDVAGLKGRKEVLYYGGPVARDGLVFLVRSAKPPEGSQLLLRDVFFTSDIELIEKLLKRKDPLEGMRVFSGYAGWGPDQLHREIARGTWHIVPADSDTVFRRDTAGIWPELIERATTKQTQNTGRSGDREGGRWENAQFERTKEQWSARLAGEKFAFFSSRSPDLPLPRLFSLCVTDRH
jgi:putative transcriptional regulator